MSTNVIERVNEFKRTGDFSILIELDKFPLEDFDHVQVRQQAYMKCNSCHCDGFTCYQHAMAYAIDHFHPGIATYIASEFPKYLNYADDFFVNILNKMLSTISHNAKSYSAFTPKRGSVLRKMNALEQKIQTEGYVIALGCLHGEIYVFRDTRLNAIIQSEYKPVELWYKGKAEEWSEQDSNQSSLMSNSHILEQDLLFTYPGRKLNTRFCGRSELEATFVHFDIRKLIQSQVAGYNHRFKDN